MAVQLIRTPTPPHSLELWPTTRTVYNILKSSIQLFLELFVIGPHCSKSVSFRHSSTKAFQYFMSMSHNERRKKVSSLTYHPSDNQYVSRLSSLQTSYANVSTVCNRPTAAFDERIGRKKRRNGRANSRVCVQILHVYHSTSFKYFFIPIATIRSSERQKSRAAHVSTKLSTR